MKINSFTLQTIHIPLMTLAESRYTVNELTEFSVPTRSEVTNKFWKTWHERRAMSPHVKAFIRKINTIFHRTHTNKNNFSTSFKASGHLWLTKDSVLLPTAVT